MPTKAKVSLACRGGGHGAWDSGKDSASAGCSPPLPRRGHQHRPVPTHDDSGSKPSPAGLSAAHPASLGPAPPFQASWGPVPPPPRLLPQTPAALSSPGAWSSSRPRAISSPGFSWFQTGPSWGLAMDPSPRPASSPPAAWPPPAPWTLPWKAAARGPSCIRTSADGPWPHPPGQDPAPHQPWVPLHLGPPEFRHPEPEPGSPSLRDPSLRTLPRSSGSRPEQRVEAQDEPTP